ncbi:MAG: SulP family inorganic anion transporter [Planctomycetota bacterium]
MPRYLPKSVVCFRSGLDRRTFLHDCLAGLTVGIIALPLAMAFGIASIPEGVATGAGISPPAMGLYTAVVAGFLISALGGSRVQIGGPTGAFIVIVYGVTMRHGYDGLLTATLLAGGFVILFGLLRLGTIIKFIPYPVTIGFTSGIALVIFSSQIKDFFGLSMTTVPAEFLHKWQAYLGAAHTFRPAALAIGLGSLVLMILLRRYAPRLPGAIVAVVASSCVVALLGMDVETIGTRFGGIPNTLPLPHLPGINLELVREVLPDAMTIAVLVAIESLLSAVVADGMIGGRHKSDCELVAQGVANVASALFGGLPATGAIARTAANVKAGGRTPLAGMVHALVLLSFMMLMAPLAKMIPLATLAAVLILVAWNMSELDHVRSILKSPRSDVLVLLVTFGLTVFVDLTVAVGVGMALACVLFMKQMADASSVQAIAKEAEIGDELAYLKDPNSVDSREVPAGVEVYEVNGPLFFGTADRLQGVFRALLRPPKIFILRMRKVATIDASGLHALEEFHAVCRRHGTTLLLSGVHAQPLVAFIRAGFGDVIGTQNLFGNIDDALNRAREILGLPPKEKPPTAVPEVARERIAAEEEQKQSAA